MDRSPVTSGFRVGARVPNAPGRAHALRAMSGGQRASHAVARCAAKPSWALARVAHGCRRSLAHPSPLGRPRAPARPLPPSRAYTLPRRAVGRVFLSRE